MQALVRRSQQRANLLEGRGQAFTKRSFVRRPSDTEPCSVAGRGQAFTKRSFVRRPSDTEPCSVAGMARLGFSEATAAAPGKACTLAQNPQRDSATALRFAQNDGGGGLRFARNDMKPGAPKCEFLVDLPLHGNSRASLKRARRARRAGCVLPGRRPRPAGGSALRGRGNGRRSPGRGSGLWRGRGRLRFPRPLPPS